MDMARVYYVKATIRKNNQLFFIHISRSFELTGEVPNLETAIEAHWLENLAASIFVSPTERAHARDAKTVSPAPDTSNTSFATVGIECVSCF